MTTKFVRLATTKVTPNSCSYAPRAGRIIVPRCWGQKIRPCVGSANHMTQREDMEHHVAAIAWRVACPLVH